MRVYLSALHQGIMTTTPPGAWLDFRQIARRSFPSLREMLKTSGSCTSAGLKTFSRYSGKTLAFFKGKLWYVASNKGGVNSAQKFFAGGYDFLHLALEMQPGDDVLAWATSVIEAYPGIPTILTTHDYLSSAGKKLPNPLIDLVRVDPKFHNNAEQLWSKLIDRHDQIFMVFCGHQRGQSLRVDLNSSGNPVYQMLANYQDRGQVTLEAGYERPRAIGDGWLRLLRFDLGAESPSIAVRTYSTYYNKFSSELDTYATWYRKKEQPQMTEAEFYDADDFVIDLEGFRTRFGDGN